MQTPSEKTTRMLFATEEQLFDKLVDARHPFRTLSRVINFSTLVNTLRELYSDLGTTGIDVEKGFKTLLIQFWEDYSDREMVECHFVDSATVPSDTQFWSPKKPQMCYKYIEDFSRLAEAMAKRVGRKTSRWRTEAIF